MYLSSGNFREEIAQSQTKERRSCVFTVNFASVPHTNSAVVRQKREPQNGGNKKTKHAKFSQKQTFLTPPHPPDTHTHV